MLLVIGLPALAVLAKAAGIPSPVETLVGLESPTDGPVFEHPRPHILDHSQYAYFAVELQDAETNPASVAAAAGLEVVGPLAPLDRHYLMRSTHPESLQGAAESGSSRLRARAEHHGPLLRRIEEHPGVAWASFQEPKKRLWKRSVYQKAELEKIWKEQLGINDPGAGKQWHLVSISGLPRVEGGMISAETSTVFELVLYIDGDDSFLPDGWRAFRGSSLDASCFSELSRTESDLEPCRLFLV